MTITLKMAFNWYHRLRLNGCAAKHEVPKGASVPVSETFVTLQSNYQD